MQAKFSVIVPDIRYIRSFPTRSQINGEEYLPSSRALRVGVWEAYVTYVFGEYGPDQTGLKAR